MCGRRLGKSIFDVAAALVGCGHVSGLFVRPGMAAGHNALRGPGPNRKHAFKDALTHAGSPDPGTTYLHYVIMSSPIPSTTLVVLHLLGLWLLQRNHSIAL